MNAETFLTDTLRPVLEDMGMWSPSAEKLLLMTACHESGGFRTRVQDGGGPARSFFQIEPESAIDLYDNHLVFRSEKMRALDKFYPKDVCGRDRIKVEGEALINDRYACAVARMIYSRDAAPLPEFEDNENMARYWKRVWNTEAGKGTVDKFLADWELYKPDGYDD